MGQQEYHKIHVVKAMIYSTSMHLFLSWLFAIRLILSHSENVFHLKGLQVGATSVLTRVLTEKEYDCVSLSSHP